MGDEIGAAVTASWAGSLGVLVDVGSSTTALWLISGLRVAVMDGRLSPGVGGVLRQDDAASMMKRVMKIAR